MEAFRISAPIILFEAHFPQRNTLVVSESLFSKMLVSMPLITLRRSITDNYQYFIRVNQTVEKILT